MLDLITKIDRVFSVLVIASLHVLENKKRDRKIKERLKRYQEKHVTATKRYIIHIGIKS